MPRYVCRFQLLAIVPAVLAGQSPLPTTQAELAAADRPAWAAALASACDTIPVDSTWRTYRASKSEASIRLRRAMGERGEILLGAWYDALPAVPDRDYALEPLDPLTTRLFLSQATSVFRCPSARHQGADSQVTILVLGFDERPREDPEEGIWNVLGTLDHNHDSLWGMSRDLSGARAFVTGMHSAKFPPKEATPP